MSQLLKIPVAKLGSWFHETHGIVTFSGDDLRSIERNFRVNARGYEPYLKIGHNEKGPGIYDDERAEAHLVDLQREGDVLFGLFEPHNDEVKADIDKGVYRYASPELIRQAKNRETGKAIDGPILRGVSLTNTPSIPNLPRNSLAGNDNLTQMLSDDMVTETVVFHLDGANMSASTPVIPAAETADEKALGFMATIAKGFETLTAKLGHMTVADEKTADETAAEAKKVADEAAAATAAAQAQTDADAKAAADQVEADAETARLAAEAQAALDAEAATKAADAARDTEMETLRAAATAAQEALAAAEVAKADAEARAAELQATAAAAEAAAAQAVADTQAAREAEAAAEAARKEGEYAQMLSDRVAKCVAAGVPPVEAQKAKDLVLALKGSVSSLMLSDNTDPVNLEDAVFELLSDRVGTIDFGQVGAVDLNANADHKVTGTPAAKGFSPNNPWKNRAKK